MATVKSVEKNLWPGNKKIDYNKEEYKEFLFNENVMTEYWVSTNINIQKMNKYINNMRVDALFQNFKMKNSIIKVFHMECKSGCFSKFRNGCLTNKYIIL